MENADMVGELIVLLHNSGYLTVEDFRTLSRKLSWACLTIEVTDGRLLGFFEGNTRGEATVRAGLQQQVYRLSKVELEEWFGRNRPRDEFLVD